MDRLKEDEDAEQVEMRKSQNETSALGSVAQNCLLTVTFYPYFIYLTTFLHNKLSPYKKN